MKKLFLYVSICSLFLIQSCLNDNEDPVLVAPITGSIVNPNVGGAAQPNQVWFDLSSGKEVVNERPDWDLGFYSGKEFKVILNGSIMMAATRIANATDIDLVKESDVKDLKEKVQVVTFDPANVEYVDTVTGEYISGYTVISEVSSNDAENGIYLINMGKDIYKKPVTAGSVVNGGESRGWMKIQVLRNGTGYKIKYAELDDSIHKELNVVKDSNYNFNFLSLKNNRELLIQPEKKNWDICFSVFTNIIDGAGTYVYSDFVTTNILGGVAGYSMKVKEPITGKEAYDNFKLEDVDPSKLVSNDHRVIGASWRNPIAPNGLIVYGDIFYVVRDAEGYYFKVRFTRMTNTEGVRGYPQFEFKPL